MKRLSQTVFTKGLRLSQVLGLNVVLKLRLLSNIWLLTAIFNIQLTVTHIPGAQNEVADLLSRWQGTDTQINKLSSYIHNYQWMPVHLDHTNLNEYV